MWELLTGVAVFIIAVAASWLGGRKSAKTDAKLEDAEDYADTIKRMDKAGRMSDADAARSWLLDRGKSEGDL